VPSITETNRIHLVLFSMQNRTLSPCLAAINRIFISVIQSCRRSAAQWQEVLTAVTGQDETHQRMTDRQTDRQTGRHTIRQYAPMMEGVNGTDRREDGHAYRPTAPCRRMEQTDTHTDGRTTTSIHHSPGGGQTGSEVQHRPVHWGTDRHKDRQWGPVPAVPLRDRQTRTSTGQ
jgi:hypothetical protein